MDKQMLKKLYVACWSTALVICSWAAWGQSTPRGVCVYNCETYAPPSVYVPQGPSPEELRRQREERDTREATDHAYDMGLDAYDRKDWPAAISRFQEALQYAPNDPDIRLMLTKAEMALRQSQAATQLKAAEAQAQALKNLQSSMNMDEQIKKESGKIFDEAGKHAGTLTIAGASRDKPNNPVIPPSRRTPALSTMETQRQSSEKLIAQLQQQLQDTQRSGSSTGVDMVKQTQIKQKISNEQNKVNFINFRISEELEKPVGGNVRP